MRDPGGIVVGADPDDGTLLIDKTSKHLRVIGASGTGKTLCFVMPTLARTWRGSAVVHDRKGELYLLLQGSRKWRRNLRFAPTERSSIRFNPFMEISTGDDAVSDCQNIAHLLPHGGKINVREPIWDQSSVALVSGMILYILNFARDGEKNFAGLIRLHEEREAASAKMQAQQHPDPWVRNYIASAARKIYENDNEKYVGSILATIDAYLEPFNNPVIAEVTGESEFRIADLVCGNVPVALFLHLPPADSERLAPLARIVLSQILNRMMSHLFAIDGRSKQHHLLFALDEYNRFGKIAAIDGAFADMRGYGCRAMIGAQSDGVLTDIYGDNALTISQSRLIALRPDYIKEAERVSKTLPVVRQVRDAESDSFGGLGERSGLSVQRSLVERPLMRPDEIISMPVETVILTGYGKPIRARRPDWWHWLDLCDPKPLALEPNPVVEMLPTRTADGRYIDLPAETVPRNPWAGIRHPVAPPPPPGAPAALETRGPTGLGGKPFDWRWERANVTPGRRTKVYPEPIGPLPALPGRQLSMDLEGTPPAVADVDDFDLV
ncbi:type IV secretion system protein VirD4 [Skermanella aerolata]|uniref:type IV secretory system conjugative DNA transfer family protein n=1 Tax=Skermanella aerolata TaxID=393310 RepID=UPI003D25696E